MALSYSFHIGSKKHAITSLKKLESVSKHNLRKFQSKIFDGSKNELLIGSNDLVKDTKKFYNDFFKNALDEYNSKQKRSDRKIKNYFNHVCDDVQKHIAVECIIQVGGYDFWEDKNLDERKKMTPIFKTQIEKLQKELPNFKIINAVIHYDEACPHVQLVGVPIKENCKRGLAVQVSKTSNFNKESLEVLQAKMREDIEKEMQEIYGKDIDLKPKEKGRNQDLARQIYINQKQLKKLQEEIEDLKAAKKLIDSDINDALVNKTKLDETNKQTKKEIEDKTKEKQKLVNEINKLKNEKDSIQKLQNDFNSAKSLVREQNMKVFESIKFETIEQKTGLFTSEQRKVCDASVVRRLIDNNETAIKIDSDAIERRIDKLIIQDREIKREHEEYSNLLRFLKKIPFVKTIIDRWWEVQFDEQKLKIFENKVTSALINTMNKQKNKDDDWEK
jgi:hypothetical protein